MGHPALNGRQADERWFDFETASGGSASRRFGVELLRESAVVQSRATSVAEYLAELPEDQRHAIQAVREVIRQNLDARFEEGILYGMIGYYVPHTLYPPGYHCDPRQPLQFAALASQKNYMSLYLMCVYGDPNQLKLFQAAWAKSGKKLNMGKSCVRFAKLDDLSLDAIADAIRRVSVKGYIDAYERVRTDARKRAPQKTKPVRKKAPARQSKKSPVTTSKPRR
jgi:hypothetical protein